MTATIHKLRIAGVLLDFGDTFPSWHHNTDAAKKFAAGLGIREDAITVVGVPVPTGQEATR